MIDTNLWKNLHIKYALFRIRGTLDKCRTEGFYLVSSWIQVYSVMQSDGNRFYGDVVLGSFNILYIDQDSI